MNTSTVSPNLSAQKISKNKEPFKFKPTASKIHVIAKRVFTFMKSEKGIVLSGSITISIFIGISYTPMLILPIIGVCYLSYFAIKSVSKLFIQNYKESQFEKQVEKNLNEIEKRINDNYESYKKALLPCIKNGDREAVYVICNHLKTTDKDSITSCHTDLLFKAINLASDKSPVCLFKLINSLGSIVKDLGKNTIPTLTKLAANNQLDAFKLLKNKMGNFYSDDQEFFYEIGKAGKDYHSAFFNHDHLSIQRISHILKGAASGNDLSFFKTILNSYLQGTGLNKGSSTKQSLVETELSVLMHSARNKNSDFFQHLFKEFKEYNLEIPKYVLNGIVEGATEVGNTEALEALINDHDFNDFQFIANIASRNGQFEILQTLYEKNENLDLPISILVNLIACSDQSTKEKIDKIEQLKEMGRNISETLLVNGQRENCLSIYLKNIEKVDEETCQLFAALQNENMALAEYDNDILVAILEQSFEKGPLGDDKIELFKNLSSLILLNAKNTKDWPEKVEELNKSIIKKANSNHEFLKEYNLVYANFKRGFELKKELSEKNNGAHLIKTEEELGQIECLLIADKALEDENYHLVLESIEQMNPPTLQVFSPKFIKQLVSKYSNPKDFNELFEKVPNVIRHEFMNELLNRKILPLIKENPERFVQDFVGLPQYIQNSIYTEMARRLLSYGISIRADQIINGFESKTTKDANLNCPGITIDNQRDELNAKLLLLQNQILIGDLDKEMANVLGLPHNTPPFKIAEEYEKAVKQNYDYLHKYPHPIPKKLKEFIERAYPGQSSDMQVKKCLQEIFARYKKQNKKQIAKPKLCALLNLGTDSSDAQIKRAYRRLQIICHPDRNPTEEQRKKGVEASSLYDDFTM